MSLYESQGNYGQVLYHHHHDSHNNNNHKKINKKTLLDIVYIVLYKEKIVFIQFYKILSFLPCLLSQNSGEPLVYDILL